MQPRPRPLLALLRPLLGVLLVGTLLSACGEDGGTGDKGYIDGKGIITRLAVGDRRPPRSEVEGETLEGETLSLAQYDGKVVVLNVWGSWCPPCRKEAPDLAEAARELGTGVAFVGVNVKDSGRDQGLAFQRRYDTPYPSLYDPSGRTLLAFRGTLNPSAIPSTVVLDAQGRVAASILGEVPSTRTLVDLVQDVQQSGGAAS